MEARGVLIDGIAEAIWGSPANKRAVFWVDFDEKAKELWRDDARRVLAVLDKVQE